MNNPLPTLLLLSVTVACAAPRARAAAPATPVSDDVLLSAIAEVETGHNASRLGRYGERTQLQILPETWREYSRLPHASAASHPRETDRVARAYLACIRNRLRARGLPETPFYIAASWNAGPGWRRLSSKTVSYAERVANLVSEATALASAQPAAEPVTASDPAPTTVAASSAGDTAVPTLSLDDTPQAYFSLPGQRLASIAVPSGSDARTRVEFSLPPRAARVQSGAVANGDRFAGVLLAGVN